MQARKAGIGIQGHGIPLPFCTFAVVRRFQDFFHLLCAMIWIVTLWGEPMLNLSGGLA